MQPSVFIIIINWNGWQDTLECLDSLKKIDYPNYRVVVVDNGSTEKFSISNFQSSDKIEFIFNKENLGFSGGNNVGIKYALENGADYVLLLNNDTVVDRSFLSELVEAAETNKKIGIVGPKIYFYEEKNRIWSAGGKINRLYNKGTLKGWQEIDQGQYDFPKLQMMPHLTGCCVLVRREVIERVGAMSEEYFLYYEDTDWSFRIRKAGYQCVFAPNAKIWHKISKSSLPESSLYIYYQVRNGLIFSSKFAPFYLNPIVHLDALWRMAKQPIKFLIPSKRKWIKPILLGIKDFYLGRKGKYENWH